MTSERAQRMFVAVLPPAAALAPLQEEVERLRGLTDGLRWTPAEHWHVTLAFLPAVPAAALEELTARLARAAARRDRLDACVSGAGAFPRASTARVLWAGVASPGQGLQPLAAAARAAARRSGVEVAENRFRAHLTLARLPRPADVGPLVSALGAHTGPSWHVEEVHLVASYLGQGPGGRPRYETVATAPVGRGVSPGGRSSRRASPRSRPAGP